MQTVMLSESTVDTRRLQIEGEKRPASQRNLAAYHELVEAGIMETVSGPERAYRLTAGGREHREAILERGTQREEIQRLAEARQNRRSDSHS
jgi:hypothetical protein